MKLKNIITTLNKIAPPEYAHIRDTKVGLQLGNKDKEVKKILVALDVDEKTVDKAVKNKVDLIIAHHALFYVDIARLDLSKPVGRKIEKLIKNDIAVFIAHTNLDAAPDGVNWTLARRESLDPQTCEVLEPTYSEKLFKYVVFVPRNDLEKVAQVAAEVGAGHIGNYSACSFRTEGWGTFKPEEGSEPHIGKKGKLEYVDEIKFETIVREDQLGDLINVINQVHPYEEVAYDVYPLKNKGEVFGIGLIGKPTKPLTIKGKKIKKLAICSGSGGSVLMKAVEKGADAYICGEVSYHDQRLAEELGVILVTKGHKETEEIIVPVLKNKLKIELKGIDII